MFIWIETNYILKSLQQPPTFAPLPVQVGVQDPNWRALDNGHDRYDRYNSERKLAPQAGYIDSRQQQFLAPPQDRFGNPVGRTFDSGRRF